MSIKPDMALARAAIVILQTADRCFHTGSVRPAGFSCPVSARAGSGQAEANRRRTARLYAYVSASNINTGQLRTPSKAWKPPRYMVAEIPVVRAKGRLQSWFFVNENECVKEHPD